MEKHELPFYIKEGKTVFYVHVPKTGGTAVERLFSDNQFRVEYFDAGGPRGLNRFRRCAPQHMHAEQITTLLRPARMDFVFMTVRDPLRRLISEYKMRSKSQAVLPPISIWFNQMCKQYQEDNYTGENHIRPQSEFWLPNCEVFRQEDGYGEVLVARIEEMLGITLKSQLIGMHHTGEVADPDPDELQKLLPHVRQFYRSDYLMFGY